MANGYYVTGRGKIYSSNSPDLVSWHDYIEKGDDPEPPIRPANGIQHERIRSSFDWGPLDVEDSEMDDYKIATWAEEVLNREHDRPFFLGCGLYKPHMPFAVPRKYHDLYPPDQIQLPHVNQKDLEDVPAVGQSLITPAYNDKVMETNNWRNAVSGFLASVRFADDMVGRVIDALDNSPHAKNTIVVLFGDHGWHLGEKLHWRKHALWEEATRTALMISAPGVSQAAVCERTVSLIDLYPTLNDLCGLTEREGLEGVSLRPLLEQPDQTWDRPVLTTHLKGNHSIRSERWRYIRYCDGTEELYDHENDKMEWTNLAGQAQYQNVIAAHKAWLPKHEAPDSKRRS